MRRTIIIVLSIITVLSCKNRNVKLNISNVYVRAAAEEEAPVLDCKSIADAESKMIDYCFRDVNGEEFDYDERFDYELFEQAIHAFPEEAMVYGFDKLKEFVDIDIYDSKDGNVRIYSWQYPAMATMGSYGSILQYRWRGKVKFGSFINEKDEFEYSTRGFYTLEDGKYIRYAYLREWSTQAYAVAEAYKLTKNGLEEIPLFETEEGLSAIIDTEYNIPDWYFRAGRGEGYNWLFYYDNDKKNLYFPSTPEYNYLSDRYVPYNWNGETMCPLSEVGNPFLYPDLQEYESLELMARTSRNIIRIDKLNNESYRYAAWPSKGDMNDTPELVLNNGQYDEKEHVWVFNNNDIEYRATESNLSVSKNGKVIAKWDIN